MKREESQASTSTSSSSSPPPSKAQPQSQQDQKTLSQDDNSTDTLIEDQDQEITTTDDIKIKLSSDHKKEKHSNEQDINQSLSNLSLKTSEEKNSSPALATQGGREVSDKILYIANLSKNVTEENLQEIFSIGGEITSLKILIDKNNLGFNYAFITFVDNESATKSFNELNDSLIDNSKIIIKWAYQSQQAQKTPDSFNVFVGDLASEVDDELLRKSFSKFKSLVQAHVMWDMQSGRSRGYGFVSFTDRYDAENCLYSMNGEWIAGRQVRLNWASHKQHQNQSHHQQQHQNYNNPQSMLNQQFSQQQPYRQVSNTNMNNNTNINFNKNNINNNNNNILRQFNNNSRQNSLGSNMNNISGYNSANINNNNNNLINSTTLNGSNLIPPPSSIMVQQNFELILRKTPSWQTTVYLGNLAHFTTQNDLIPLLQTFGFIVDLKFYPDKGCAFVKYDTHERAAMAIVQLSGILINGRPLKTGWGKERSNNNINNINTTSIVNTIPTFPTYPSHLIFNTGNPPVPQVVVPNIQH